MQLGCACIHSGLAGFLGRFFLVKACILGSGRTNDTVPHDFGGGNVGCLCGQFTGVVDEISASGDMYMVGVSFLWAIIDNNPGVGDYAIFRNVCNFIMGEEEDGV